MVALSASRAAYKPVSELARRGLLSQDDSLWSGERPESSRDVAWLWIALAVGLLGFRLLIPAADELPPDYAARLAERFPAARLVSVRWTGTVDQPAFRCRLQEPSGTLHNVQIWGDGTIQSANNERIHRKDGGERPAATSTEASASRIMP